MGLFDWLRHRDVRRVAGDPQISGRTSDQWMAYIQSEVAGVCVRAGWAHQVRRNWAVRERPVRQSRVEDLEWKLLPDGAESADPQGWEGRYFVLRFDRTGGKFVLLHDNYQGGDDLSWDFTTSTEFPAPAGPGPGLPAPGWLEARLSLLTQRFDPNQYSYT